MFWDGTETAATLTSRNAGGGQRMPDKDNFMSVVEPVAMSDRKGNNGITTDGTALTLTAQEKERPLVSTMSVRRLTPLECERLQGFPDHWTLIGEPEEVDVKDYDTEYDEDGNEIGKTFVGTHKEIEYFFIDRNGKKKRCADSSRSDRGR